MFTKFHIKNFRTHVDTEISLKDLTLIIGGNNSGKTNLLEAICFFSNLVRDSLVEKEKENLYIDRHILSDYEMPICFTCEWKWREVKIIYNIECNWGSSFTEKLIYTDDKKRSIYEYGFNEDEYTKVLMLAKILKDSLFCRLFFEQLSSFSYYNFQPFSLKKQGKDYNGYIKNIANEFGKEGANFQSIVKYIKEKEDNIYNTFIGFLRRFEESFIGITIQNEKVEWQFDMGLNNPYIGGPYTAFPAFSPEKVSEGLLKAGALALLCALSPPPPIIMIEEIENGINQKNLSEFLKWMHNTVEYGAEPTQFILTSHSPSVIREFSDKLDCVYNVHLKRKKGYVSEVTNLNEALKPLVRFGSIKEDAAFEKDGIVHIRPHALTELFYNGILAEL